MARSQEEIGAAIRGAKSYLHDHPDEARYADSAATARIDQGLRVVVSGPDGASMTTDMPAGVGGSDGAPGAGWQMRAAHAACIATLAAMRAAETGVTLTDLEVTVDSESDDHGILGMADDVVAGPLGTRVRLRIAGDSAADDQLRELAEWAWRHCPVDDAIRRAVPVRVELEVGRA